jgi:hypothetical protein
LLPAIADAERVTIKYLTKINKKYQSFGIRKGALREVDPLQILLAAIFPPGF